MEIPTGGSSKYVGLPNGLVSPHGYQRLPAAEVNDRRRDMAAGGVLDLIHPANN